jgi:hypothetical protein
MSDREKVHLMNLRRRLMRAINEQAPADHLVALVAEINETTDKLLNAREN